MANSKKIFVSHAAKDKVLADALIDLMETGTQVSSDDVFCSSLEGLGVPSGKDFINYIKDQVQHPDVVIFLLTPNYFASQFCLAELGASWALSHAALPLLVPPLTYADVKGVLLTTQVDRLDNENDLDRFYEGLSEHLSLPSKSVARWGAKRSQFVKKLPDILASIGKPGVVSVQEHEKLKAKLDDATNAINEYEEENAELKALVSKLEACKDAVEVLKVKAEHGGEYQILLNELSSVKEALGELPPIVAYVMYRDYCGIAAKFNPWDERMANDDGGSAVEEGYLQFDDGFSLNLGDPAVKLAKKELEKLDRFIDKSIAEEVSEQFKIENKYELSLSNRRLWKDYLCAAMSRYMN